MSTTTNSSSYSFSQIVIILILKFIQKLRFPPSISKVRSHSKYIHIQLNLLLCTATKLHSSCSSRESCLFTIALGITLKMAFEPIEFRKLSDVDGDIFPSFKSRVVKAFLCVFNVIFWNFQVPQFLVL